MKLSKQNCLKLSKLRYKYPNLLKLFPDSEQLNSAVLDIISGYANSYGIRKIFNRFINCYCTNPQEYNSQAQFVQCMRERLGTLIYEEFEKSYDDGRNNILTYFNDVKQVYTENDQFKEEIEFLPENREKFIKSNLKLVVSTAKRYMNLGVPFEDLIGAGNVGLCEAFDKFRSQKNIIRDAILDRISNSDKHKWTKFDVKALLEEYYTYGNILTKLEKKIPAGGFYSSDTFAEWVKNNIKTAVFASVAFMWIRAYILIEINKNAYIVKIPKGAKDDVPIKSNFISISEYSNTGTDAPDIDIPSSDDTELEEKIDIVHRKEHFKDSVNKLLSTLTARERRIILKRFGIGMPVPMKISEIAEDENISTSRCMSIYKTAMDKIQNLANSEEFAKIAQSIKENI